MSSLKKNIKPKVKSEFYLVTKFQIFYMDLFTYCLSKDLDLSIYSKEQIRTYFTDGKDIYQTYKELLSDFPL